MKTFFAYLSFILNYGLSLSFKIIFYELKFRNYYKDNTPKYISNDKLEAMLTDKHDGVSVNGLKLKDPINCENW